MQKLYEEAEILLMTSTLAEVTVFLMCNIQEEGSWSVIVKDSERAK